MRYACGKLYTWLLLVFIIIIIIIIWFTNIPSNMKRKSIDANRKNPV